MRLSCWLNQYRYVSSPCVVLLLQVSPNVHHMRFRDLNDRYVHGFPANQRQVRASVSCTFTCDNYFLCECSSVTILQKIVETLVEVTTPFSFLLEMRGLSFCINCLCDTYFHSSFLLFALFCVCMVFFSVSNLCTAHDRFFLFVCRACREFLILNHSDDTLVFPHAYTCRSSRRCTSPPTSATTP